MAQGRNSNRNYTGRSVLARDNPKNNDSPLYLALTRLFSGPLANYRQQAQLRFKRRDLDRFNLLQLQVKASKRKAIIRLKPSKVI